MNRFERQPLWMLLACAGVALITYSLTLLPTAVTFLVVGLLAIGGATMWLYRPRAAEHGGTAIPDTTGQAGIQPQAGGMTAVSEPAAEVTESLAQVSQPAVEVSQPAVEVSQPAVEISEPAVAVSEPGPASDPEEATAPAPGPTITLLPEQWQMLQRWMEIAAQGQPVADAWAPPAVADESEPESAAAAPAAQPLAVLLPDPAALQLPARPSPARQATAPQGDPPRLDPPRLDPEEEANAASPATRPARRSSPVVAQATTYQDGEITKRSQITLRLSGRMRR